MFGGDGISKETARSRKSEAIDGSILHQKQRGHQKTPAVVRVITKRKETKWITKTSSKEHSLLQLSSSIWACSRVLNQAVLAQKLGENNEWLRGRKYLINPELLGPIKTCVHQSRNHINRFALPFPVTSLYLIPKDSITVIDERLQFYHERFLEKVEDFCAIYGAAREEAKQVLGDLFNETDYPEDIRTKFKYEYRYLTLGVPGKTSLLTPEIYEREKEKFQSLMEETREVAICALRTEFGQLVTHLTDRLNSNGG